MISINKRVCPSVRTSGRFFIMALTDGLTIGQVCCVHRREKHPVGCFESRVFIMSKARNDVKSPKTLMC